MKSKSAIYAVLFAVFSFAALFMVSRLSPGFELFTKLYFEVPAKVWFGDTQLLSYGISLGLIILTLSSLATAFLVLLSREEKPALVSTIAGVFTLVSSILLFGFYTSTLLFSLGVFLGVFLFAGGAGKSLAKGERLSAGGKIVTAFFFVNIFIGVGTYLAFSQNAASYGETVFEKLIDNSLVMMTKVSGGMTAGILNIQNGTVDATAYGMNQYLIAQGQQPVPALVITVIKGQVTNEVEKGLSNVVDRTMVRSILEPLLHGQLVSLFPIASAFFVFFLLEFLRNGFKLFVPLFVVLLTDIERLSGKGSSVGRVSGKSGGGLTNAEDEGRFTSSGF